MSKTFVITNPMIAANKSAEVTLSKFLRVISTKDAEIIVIGGNVTVESDLSDVRLISEYRIEVEKVIERNVEFCRIYERLGKKNQELVYRLMEQLETGQGAKKSE